MFVAVKVIKTPTFEIKAINFTVLLVLKKLVYAAIQIPLKSIATSKLIKMSLTIFILLVFNTFSMFDD